MRQALLAPLLALVLLAPSFATQTPPTQVAVVKFVGMRHGLASDDLARAQLQESIQNITRSKVTIDTFDMSDQESGNSLVVWHSDLVTTCSEGDMQQLLASIRNPQTHKYTRDFKMFLGPEFSHPRRVEIQWLGACENLSRKRTLSSVSGDGGVRASSSSSRPKAAAAATSPSNATGTTAQQVSEQTPEPTTTTPAPTTTTPEPTTTTPAPNTITEVPTTTTEPPAPTTTTEAPVTEPVTEPVSAPVTQPAILLDFVTSSGENATSTQEWGFEPFSMPSDDDFLESSSVTKDDQDQTTPAGGGGGEPPASSMVDNQDETTPAGGGEPPASSMVDIQDQTTPAGRGEQPALSTADRPHYGKYVGLTTGFLIFVAYIACARAYRRQGMYELHEST